VIDWGQIIYGAVLSAVVTAAVFALVRRERSVQIVALATSASLLGPLAWNAVLHRAATEADGFVVDIPFKPFPVSWQDTGSGVFTLAVASVLVGVALRRERAGRALSLSATAAVVAFVVDVYLY
jgi:hypothetical protein